MFLTRIKKMLISLTVASALSVILVGCGNTTTTTPIDQSQTTVEITDNNTDNNTETNAEPAQLNIYEYDASTGHEFRGVFTGIEVTGIEEFESIKTAAYEDIPAEGNVFVVMYIDLSNFLNKAYYFNRDFCKFTVDGVSTESTILVNEPKEDYQTIYGYVEQGATSFYYDRRGFLAIEAPKDWKEITFTYTGWEYDDYGNARIINHFTRDELNVIE